MQNTTQILSIIWGFVGDAIGITKKSISDSHPVERLARGTHNRERSRL